MEQNYTPLALPSKFKTYDNVDPTAVKIRVLKGKDEKLIAEITYDNIDRKFLDLMTKVIIGMDVKKMTLGDRRFIMVWLAINSYSKDFPVEFICQVCLQKIEYVVDLAKFEVLELPDDFHQPYTLTLSSGSTINVRLLTIEDEIKVADFEKAGHNSWLYRYALSIVNDKKVLDNMEFLEALDVRDVAKIRAFQEKYDHGPVMSSVYECSKCGGNGKIAVPFRLEMLFPYGYALKRAFADGV